jgi:hypothetical protein
MTVVTAAVTSRYIAVASDSMITRRQPDGTYRPEKDRPTKIFRVDAYPAAISFFGTIDIDGWAVLDFLDRCALQARTISVTLEGFTEYIRAELNARIRGRSIGVGVHVTGYEIVDGLRIPEAFFVTNYCNLQYDVQNEVKNGRHTYKQLFTTEPHPDDALPERRKACAEKLASNPLDFVAFFHGDPHLLPVFMQAQNVARMRAEAAGWLKDRYGSDLPRALAVEPVRALIAFQDDLCRPEYRTVGKPIHDLVFDAQGVFSSQSGD